MPGRANHDEDAMTQALHHAIYSAILNTDATATFILGRSCKDAPKQSQPSLAAAPGLSCTRSQLEAVQFWQSLYSQYNTITFNPHIGDHEELFVPNQNSPTLVLKVTDWRRWAYTDGSCHIKHGNKKLEQASSALSLTAKTTYSLTVLELPTPNVELN
eukprot:566064-Pelagomonas_calceolata.AAC.1